MPCWRWADRNDRQTLPVPAHESAAQVKTPWVRASGIIKKLALASPATSKLSCQQADIKDRFGCLRDECISSKAGAGKISALTASALSTKCIWMSASSDQGNTAQLHVDSLSWAYAASAEESWCPPFALANTAGSFGLAVQVLSVHAQGPVAHWTRISSSSTLEVVRREAVVSLGSRLDCWLRARNWCCILQGGHRRVHN